MPARSSSSPSGSLVTTVTSARRSEIELAFAHGAPCGARTRSSAPPAPCGDDASRRCRRRRASRARSRATRRASATRPTDARSQATSIASPATSARSHRASKPASTRTPRSRRSCASRWILTSRQAAERSAAPRARNVSINVAIRREASSRSKNSTCSSTISTRGVPANRRAADLRRTAPALVASGERIPPAPRIRTSRHRAVPDAAAVAAANDDDRARLVEHAPSRRAQREREIDPEVRARLPDAGIHQATHGLERRALDQQARRRSVVDLAKIRVGGAARRRSPDPNSLVVPSRPRRCRRPSRACRRVPEPAKRPPPRPLARWSRAAS